MAKPKFITVPEELLEHAEAVAEWFDDRGWTVRPERPQIGAPYTATMTCTRRPTTTYVEVDTDVNISRVEEWHRYCLSSSKDTRIAVCVSGEAPRATAVDSTLQELGVGLYVSSGSSVMEMIAPKDVAVNIALPMLNTMPKKMRELLGDAYDQFDHSHWKEGFKEACGVLEVEARRYLTVSIESGRVVVLTEAGNVSQMTRKSIDKMTLGGLAGAFARIRNPNHADTVIAQVLDSVNPDRVGATHHKSQAATEARLRKNVGHHMWEVVAALKELV
jgi:hypothetical protein